MSVFGIDFQDLSHPVQEVSTLKSDTERGGKDSHATGLGLTKGRLRSVVVSYRWPRGGCFLKSQEESQKLGGFFSQARKLRAGSDLWAMTNNVLNPDPRHCALWARDGILGENICTSSAPSKIWAGKIRLGKVWRRWDLPSQQWKQVSYLLLPCCSLLFSSIYSDSG